MPGPRHLFVVQMDVPADKDAVMNEVYDTDHLPLMCGVPGVLEATRYRAVSGGPYPVAQGGHRYLTIYALASPAVLDSEAYRSARDGGRWRGEVGPHTINLSTVIYDRLNHLPGTPAP